MIETIFSLATLWYLMLFFYIPACVGLVVIVLLQKGKGVGFSGAFGMGGGGEAIFGPRSSRSLPQQMTYAMAGIFMVLALFMSVISGKVNRGAAPELSVDPSAEAAAATAGKLDTLLDPNAPVPAEGSTTAPATDSAATTSTMTVPVTPADAAGTPAEAPTETAAPAAETTPESPTGMGVLSPNSAVEPADASTTPASESTPEAPTETPVSSEPAPTAPAEATPAPAAATETPQ